MNLKRIFSKLGHGVGSIAEKAFAGVKKAGGVLADVNDIPLANTIVGMVPVVGPWLSLAMKRADQAENMFVGRTRGTEKMAWALEALQEDFERLGVREKRIRGLLELALLFNKNEAFFVDAGSVLEEIMKGKEDEPKPSESEVDPEVASPNTDEPQGGGGIGPVVSGAGAIGDPGA